MDIKCAHTELIDIDLLIPNPKNPNKHPENQIKLLAKIMKHQGWRSPIVVSNRSGFIVKGHGRLQAARLNKWTQAPVDRQDYANEADEYADMVADNKIAELSETDLIMVNDGALELPDDFDLELLGIPDFELIDTEKIDPGCDEDEIPEYVEPKTKLGDIYTLGNHRLMCGDSTSIDAVEKLMDGQKADMLFTDPPYGDNHASMEMDLEANKIGKSIVKKSNKISSDENLDFLMPAMNCAQAVLKDNSTKIVFFKWKKWNEIIEATAAFGEPSSCCVWDRISIAAATFRFNPVHEFVFHWGNLSDKRSKSNLTNVWRCKKELENKVLHPTVKPIEIIEPAIEVCTDKGNAILDLFGGSGSTLIACEKTNRKCFMMELDPHYCDVIVARWEKYTGKKAELLNV